MKMFSKFVIKGHHHFFALIIQSQKTIHQIHPTNALIVQSNNVRLSYFDGTLSSNSAFDAMYWLVREMITSYVHNTVIMPFTDKNFTVAAIIITASGFLFHSLFGNHQLGGTVGSIFSDSTSGNKPLIRQ